MTYWEQAEKVYVDMPNGMSLFRRDVPGDTRVTFDVIKHDPAGPAWPRPEITVEVWRPHEAFGEMSDVEVSWPSTSDKRPELAMALARALERAYGEANEMRLAAS